MPASGLLNGMMAAHTPIGGAQRADAAVRNRARHRLAVEPAALAFHEDREVGRRSDFRDRVLQRLAGFGGDDLAELVLAGAQQRGRPTQNLAAAGRRQPAPGVGGAARRVRRRGPRPARRRASRASGRRSSIGQRFSKRRAARRFDLAIVDPVENAFGIHQESSDVSRPSARAVTRASDRPGDRRRIEAVMLQHFGVAAAGRHVGEADRQHLAGARANGRARRRPSCPDRASRSGCRA